MAVKGKSGILPRRRCEPRVKILEPGVRPLLKDLTRKLVGQDFRVAGMAAAKLADREAFIVEGSGQFAQPVETLREWPDHLPSRSADMSAIRKALTIASAGDSLKT
jgi:hypothetical protein